VPRRADILVKKKKDSKIKGYRPFWGEEKKKRRRLSLTSREWTLRKGGKGMGEREGREKELYLSVVAFYLKPAREGGGKRIGAMPSTGEN